MAKLMPKAFLQTKYHKVVKDVQILEDGTLVSEYLEVNNGPVLVDKAFIPAKVQIEQAIAAGENMHMFKLAQYHAMNPDEIPDDYYDPLTILNYDPTDAQMDLRRIAANMVEGRKRKLAKEQEVQNAEKSAEQPIVESNEGNSGNTVGSGNNGQNGTE